MNDRKQPGRVLCVLGMHRSGTSCLTGSLQEAGLELGDFHSWNPHNRKGNRENQKIVDLNDAVLAANNAAWDRPVERVEWPIHLSLLAKDLIASYEAADVFCFKDPRTLLTLDGWIEAFPRLEFIGIFRDPRAVSQSLHNRSGMPKADGYALWEAYNRRLFSYWERYQFPVLCFDEDQSAFLQKLRQLLVDRFRMPSDLPFEFYDPSLRKAKVGEETAIPKSCADLYDQLKRIMV